MPVGKYFLKFLQLALHLDKFIQRLARLAGSFERIRLLHQTVNDDVLVVGTFLRARARQRDGQEDYKCGQEFHVHKITTERGLAIRLADEFETKP